MPCTIQKLFQESVPFFYQSVTLRMIAESDMNYVSDMFDVPLNEDTLKLFMLKVMNAYRSIKILEIAVENENHEFIGMVDIYDIHETECEIGYRICRKQRNKGYAKKAVAGLLEMLREHGMTCIHARSETDNIASESILKDNGFICKKEKDNIRYWEVQL